MILYIVVIEFSVFGVGVGHKLFNNWFIILFYAEPVRIVPNVGSLLGGFPIKVSGPCFKGGAVLCRFNKTVILGIVASPLLAICIPKMFTRVGVVPLSVSVDGGVTYTSPVNLELGMISKLIHPASQFLFNNGVANNAYIHIILRLCIPTDGN